MKNLYKFKINYTFDGGMYLKYEPNIKETIKRRNSEELSKIFANSFKNNEKILNLSYRLNDDDLKVVVDVLLDLDDFIEELLLEGNFITDEGVIYLANILIRKKLIKIFTISGFDITSIGANALAECLENNTNIERFEITGTRFGNMGANAFSNILNSTSIKELNISTNSIGNEGIVNLADTLKNNDKITHLNLSINDFDFNVSHELAEVIKVNKTIINLNLYSTNLGDQGTLILAEVLRENNTIRSLNLDENEITEEGAKAISEVLLTNNSIIELKMFNNNISNAGAIELANVLKSNNTLIELDISGNNIGDDGGISFGETLKVNKSITDLNMNNNLINHEGAIALVQGLRENVSIKKFSIFDNNIGLDAYLMLVEILNINNNINLEIGYQKLDKIILPKDTIIYRSDENIALQNMPTYFAEDEKTAKIYETYNKKFIKYKLKKNVELLNISNLDTINSLLNISFNTDKDFYKIVKKVFISEEIEQAYSFYKALDINYNDIEIDNILSKSPKFINFKNYLKLFKQNETEKQPWQVSEKIRNSEKDNDFIFVKNLCDKFNYKGYIADEMLNVHGSVLHQFFEENTPNVNDSVLSKTFHEEIMLCNPVEVLIIPDQN